jgi:hypothetical protein
MLHVFLGEILANMTRVSDVAPGPLVFKNLPLQNQQANFDQLGQIILT